VSRQNVEIVRRVVDALNRRDIRAAANVWTVRFHLYQDKESALQAVASADGAEGT
jgi:hypothetical protein